MPGELKTERIQLMMTPSEVKAVDDWSFANRIRGRAEAIRRLIELGLNDQTQADPHVPKREAKTVQKS